MVRLLLSRRPAPPAPEPDAAPGGRAVVVQVRPHRGGGLGVIGCELGLQSYGSGRGPLACRASGMYLGIVCVQFCHDGNLDPVSGGSKCRRRLQVSWALDYMRVCVGRFWSLFVARRSIDAYSPDPLSRRLVTPLPRRKPFSVVRSCLTVRLVHVA